MFSIANAVPSDAGAACVRKTSFAGRPAALAARQPKMISPNKYKIEQEQDQWPTIPPALTKKIC